MYSTSTTKTGWHHTCHYRLRMSAILTQCESTSVLVSPKVHHRFVNEAKSLSHCFENQGRIQLDPSLIDNILIFFQLMEKRKSAQKP